MATLKSPRNTRKKKLWSALYSQRVHTKNISLAGPSSPRSRHKLQTFLRNSAYWVVSESARSSTDTPLLPEFIQNDKPPVYIKYGVNTLDYTKVYPFVLTEDLRDPKAPSRLVFWSNVSSCLPATRGTRS